jgi:predicted nuclease with TOPRIM domain
MPMDTPLILTHDHDPKVVFRGQFNPYVLDTLQAPADPPSYNDLWTNFQHLSRTYNDLVSQHHDLSDAHQALQVELNNFRDSCWSLRSRQQELVDDATKARIQSWRHIVRVEELEKELGTLRHGETHLGYV